MQTNLLFYFTCNHSLKVDVNSNPGGVESDWIWAVAEFVILPIDASLFYDTVCVPSMYAVSVCIIYVTAMRYSSLTPVLNLGMYSTLHALCSIVLVH